MRLQVQLYIDTSGDPTSEQPTYERVDLNDFESIELTSSVQDVRNIDKVFTDYSRQFTLPASAQNNSVFKHYYNTNIFGGFDARIKQRAYISLNGILFREGFIRLSEVTRKNERASMYKVVFFGAMVSLKQVLGDLKLAALSGLSKFNHPYNKTVVNNGFVTGLGLQGETMVTSVNRDVVYPAISAFDRWFYDSSSVSDPESLVFAQGESRNIYNDESNGDYGIDYLHLKPAIKVLHIIEAIESRFSSIKFSRDFFGRAFFNKLYLLLHNTKGLLSPSNSLQDPVSITFNVGTDSSNSDFEYLSGEPDQRPMETAWSFSVYNGFLGSNYFIQKYEVIASVTVSAPSSGSNYRIKVLNNQFVIAESGALSGSGSVTATLCTENFTTHSNIKVVVESASPTNLTTFELGLELKRVEYFLDPSSVEDPCTPPSNVQTTTYSSFYDAGGDVNTLTNINIVEHMPDMTILSFLQGLFKAFNLTSEVNSDGEIVVKTLNKFYDDGQNIDITDYVITDEDTLSRVELFNNIKFKYSEPKTFGMLKQNEVLQDDFGNLEFQLSPNGTERNLAFDGKKYEVKLPFEKLFFDRLKDENPSQSNPIDFGNGWLADSNQSPTITKPIIFFNEHTTVSNNEELGFKDIGTFTQYNRPSNTTVDGGYSLHFGEEIDEYSGQPVTRSLFRLFYQDYISNLYNISNRMFSVKAYLPLSFLISYNMNDKMIIRGKYYTINSIRTNLTTGQSQLELIPEFTQFVQDAGSDITPPTVPTNLALGARTNTSIDFNWTESTDNVAVTGYNVYVDGSLEQTLGVTTQSSLNRLDVNTAYSIEVSAFDAAGNESAKSTAVSMSTANLPDATPPTIPLNVLVTAVSSSTVTLSWSPSSDNVGVTGYKVYVDGLSLVSLGNVTSYQVTGLTQSTTYSFNITAFDAEGNESQFSQTVSETTTLPINT